MSDEQTPEEEPPNEAVATADEEETPEAHVEARYRRSIAITLALLAVLGAFIAILGGNAGGNESRSARQSTRLASEAQAARVIQLGADSTAQQIDSEIATLPLRPGFAIDPDAAAAAGATVDPATEVARIAASDQELRGLFNEAADQEILFDLQVAARQLTLEQAAVVDERVTWNARASQYETVVTVLGVALFLIGFAAVVGRKLRPPLALPGILLAVYCLGWSVFIYYKDIPDVPPDAIEQVALGDALLADQQFDASIAAYDTAIELDDTYRPAVEGRALAQAIAANPDLLNTLAITDSDSELFQAAVTDILSALDLGGDEDVRTATTAGVIALAAGELDLAAEAFETAIGLNPLTPGLQLSLSAIEEGRGNHEAALEWRQSGADQLGPAVESDANRSYAALYYTVLEYVAALTPDRTDQLTTLRDDTVAAESQIAAGVELTGQAPTGVTVSVTQVDFIDGQTTIDLDAAGVPPDSTITLVGYERPADGASFVQPAELFYVGPLGGAGGGALTLTTPRNCHPTEYRFDLYVEGVFVDSVTAPGVSATC
jgi:tetratricopeptide (TPR) repeat protein